MKVSRRVVRSGLAGLGLAVAFLFMASIIVPKPSEAGPDGAAPDPMSAESIEAMEPLGRIEGTRYTVVFYATPTGPLFSVYDRHGNELATLLTPSQLDEQFPDMGFTDAYADVPLSMMGSDVGGRH